MTLVCTFTVPGQPIPKARARVVKGRAYTPARTVAAELRIAHYLKVAYPHLKPVAGRVSIVLHFYLKGAQTCDWDNLSKLVCDALNGRAWVDDRQIGIAEVDVVRNDREPRTEITVREYS